MIGVGLLFAGSANYRADIERTLAFASSEGMDCSDYRTLSVLTTWLGVHHRAVNVDRLLRLVRQLRSARVRIYWAAIAHWLAPYDSRFTRLAGLHRGATREPLHGTQADVDFQVARHGGEDPRLAGGPLRVPRGLLRDRATDVSDAQWMVRWHASYRWRCLIGGSYVAEILAALE